MQSDGRELVREWRRRDPRRGPGNGVLDRRWTRRDGDRAETRGWLGGECATVQAGLAKDRNSMYRWPLGTLACLGLTVAGIGDLLSRLVDRQRARRNRGVPP